MKTAQNREDLGVITTKSQGILEKIAGKSMANQLIGSQQNPLVKKMVMLIIALLQKKTQL